MRRWFKKLCLAFGILLCGVVLLVPRFDLYTAWRYHAVYVGGRLPPGVFSPYDWVSYETHPVAFKYVVLFDGFLTVVFIGVAVFVAWHTPIQRGIWRKRKARPPVDDAIRQSMSER